VDATTELLPSFAVGGSTVVLGAQNEFLMIISCYTNNVLSVPAGVLSISWMTLGAR